LEKKRENMLNQHLVAYKIPFFDMLMFFFWEKHPTTRHLPLAGRQVCDGLEDLDLLHHLYPEAWQDVGGWSVTKNAGAPLRKSLIWAMILLGLIVYEPWYQLTDLANTNLET